MTRGESINKPSIDESCVPPVNEINRTFNRIKGKLSMLSEKGTHFSSRRIRSAQDLSSSRKRNLIKLTAIITQPDIFFRTSY